MATMLRVPRRLFDPLPPPLGPLGDDPLFAQHWLLESWLLRVRWRGMLTILAVIPLSLNDSPLLSVLLALGLTAGNLGITRLMQRAPDPPQLRAIQRFATFLEWAVVLSIMCLHSDETTGLPQAILLVLMVITGARYRLQGLWRATIAAVVIVAGLVLVQSLVFKLLTTSAAIQVFVAWACLMWLMALIIRGVLQASGEWVRWREGRWDHERAGLQGLRYRLSPQERKVLPFLVHEGLTYEEIGKRLCISGETVKTHTRRIGAKLGVSGSRAAVVAAAQTLGLLSSGEPGPATDEDADTAAD